MHLHQKLFIQWWMSWFPVPSSNGATCQGSSQTCSRAGGTDCLWNFDLGTYNVRTLASEGSLKVLFKELEGIKWHIIGLSLR